MYLASDVLQRIDQQLGLILAFTAIAWITGFVQIFEAIRLGQRDRLPGAPAGMTIFLLAHDSSFFLRYDYWFHQLGHWYFELYWFGMGVAVLIELFMFAQLVRYGRNEIAPWLSPKFFLMLLLLYQLATYALLWWLQGVLDDPLYLISLTATQVVAVIFNLPMLLRRGSARGQSRIYAWATLLGPGSLALGLFPALSPELFLHAKYIGACFGLMCLSLFYIVLLERARRRHGRGAST